VVRELQASRDEQDPARLAFLLQLMEVQLENAAHQRAHLNQLKREGNLKC
ncbi:hypothetical protein TSOC_013378, partial [Tetrabaena socialis]